MNDRKLDPSRCMLEYLDSSGVKRIPLGEVAVTVGRHYTNKIPIADNKASRLHCEFFVKDGSVWVRDLNSSNGTYVNGQGTTAAKLNRNDVVHVGTTKFALVDRDDGPVLVKNRPAATAGKKIGVVPPRSNDEPLELSDLDDAPPDLSALEEVRELTPETLDAADVVELGADDLVGAGQSPASKIWAQSLGAGGMEGGPISLEGDDLSSDNYNVDAVAMLEGLANSLPDKVFGPSDISLAGARGQLVHPAGKVAKSGETVDILRLILVIATRGRGTDIHIEPRERGFQVRMRVDGTMISAVRMPTAAGIRLQALVKVLSEIDLAERNSVQEGHFSALVPSERIGTPRKIDYRVSFAPSVFGQKLVMRILDTTYAPTHVRKLCLPGWMQSEVESAIRKDAGMVLVCGPTGSGKTTTLYALVRGSNVQQRNAITIEDPIEMQLESVTQIQVDEAHDKGFAALLRSVLRQDPDVIMIGEIRDAETARIAMQAALTGHLVFSTIHTRDTVGTIFRLLDLEIEPYLVAQALHQVLAQRLVRQLCPSCKTSYAPSKAEITAMGESASGVTRLFRPKGCPQCLGTGYRGRRGFFELLTANDALKDIIVKTPTLEAIQEALSQTRFQSLRHSGYQLVAEGAVAFGEIERIAGQFKE